MKKENTKRELLHEIRIYDSDGPLFNFISYLTELNRGWEARGYRDIEISTECEDYDTAFFQIHGTRDETKKEKEKRLLMEVKKKEKKKQEKLKIEETERKMLENLIKKYGSA